MSEMAQTADHIIVLGRGKVVADAPMTEFVSNGRSERLMVRTPDAAKLASLLLSGSKPEVRLEPIDDSGFETTGLAASTVGSVAAQNGIELHELSPIAASLEDAYLALTRDQVEYATA
jgi:ABC-2 type transport system ATP-binding protein